MTDPTRDIDDIDAIALLDEPARRTLYEWVIRQGRPVSRDEAAAGTGVSRPLAAFHLDRLAKAGLLTTGFRRLSGKSGPGAGRPSKLYARTDRDIRVSLPERRYDIAAELMAKALEDASGVGDATSLRQAAHRLGEGVGSADDVYLVTAGGEGAGWSAYAPTWAPTIHARSATRRVRPAGEPLPDCGPDGCIVPWAR